MAAEYLSRRNYLHVKELLAEGQDFEKVAEIVGLSATLVCDIAAERVSPSRIVVEDDDPLREQMLTSRRCSGCGAMVFRWPCLACQMASGSAAPIKPHLSLDQLLDKQRRLQRAQRKRRDLPEKRAA